MNILIITQVLPYPPDSGPKIKTYNVIKYLSQQNQMTLVSFVRGDQSEHIRHLKKYCRNVHTVPIKRGVIRDVWYMLLSFITNQPFMMLRDGRKPMHRLVKRLRYSQRFDVVHADQLNMAQYAEQLSETFKVLDEHNALWLLYKRLWATMPAGPRKWLLGRDWRLIRSYEKRKINAFDAVLAVSHEDKCALQKITGEPVDINIIPIAIDTKQNKVIERDPEPKHILHLGTMYWPPNIDAVKWFINYVYPIIRRQRSDVSFDVVGSRPPAELLSLNDNASRINVTGYVDDPSSYQRRAAVMVVPLLAGGGMRVKILNALAEGVPIVSTSLGCEGIEVSPGRDILVGDTPEAFAAQVLQVLNDPDLDRQLALNGRRLVEEKYDYRNVCRKIVNIYSRAAQEHSA